MSDRFPISEKFSLMGNKITVKYDPGLIHREGDVGRTAYRDLRVILQPTVEGFPLQENEILRVFCHELVHYIFHSLNRIDLRDDEVVVDNVGSLLHQFLITREGELKK